VAYYLPLRKCLGQDVCSHVVGWTVYEIDNFPRDALANEMVSNVDVLCACVIVVINRKRERGLIVAVKGCPSDQQGEQFAYEATEPDALLCGMRSRDIFRLRCG